MFLGSIFTGASDEAEHHRQQIGGAEFLILVALKVENEQGEGSRDFSFHSPS